jgi:TolB-like protein
VDYLRQPVVAQVVGAAASVAPGIFVLQRTQNTNATPGAALPARVDTARASGEVAVAVLPLSNYSGDGQDYFADGMTEALTAELAQFDGLHVISRTSTMRYKTEPKPMPEVARELGVDFVVTSCDR